MVLLPDWNVGGSNALALATDFGETPAKLLPAAERQDGYGRHGSYHSAMSFAIPDTRETRGRYLEEFMTPEPREKAIATHATHCYQFLLNGRLAKNAIPPIFNPLSSDGNRTALYTTRRYSKATPGMRAKNGFPSL